MRLTTMTEVIWSTLRLKWDAAAGTERRLDRTDETLTGGTETRIRRNLAFTAKTPLRVEHIHKG